MKMSFAIYCSLLLSLFLINIVVAEDKSVNGENVFVKALGKSGRISIAWSKDIDNDTDKVVFDLDEIKEYDATGKEVTTTGSVKHSFNNFANQNFTISEVTTVTLNNVNMKNFNFRSQLKDLTSAVTISVYIAQADGSITFGNETIPIKKDHVKFSILLSSWQWCNASNKCSADGAYLELSIAVTSKSAPSKLEKDKKVYGDATPYSLGSGKLLLSHQVKIDENIWVNMPNDYPKFESKNNKQIYTFRFPKFSQSALYDPTVAGDDDTTGAASRLANFSSFALFIFAAIIAKILAA